MSIYRRPASKFWHYKFEYRGLLYRGTTGQVLEQDARDVEAATRLKVRRAAHGLDVAAPAPTLTPTFRDFAEFYYADAVKRGMRADRVLWMLRVALRFWGRRPEKLDRSASAADPFHDLRLGDVIADPSWVLKWEKWLSAPHPVRQAPPVRRAGTYVASTEPPKMATWSAQTKNQYRSLMSQMYKLAMSQEYFLQTGVTSNPFTGRWRDRSDGRTVALDVDDLRAILAASSFHLRLAIAIGVLAPKFRLSNITGLRWNEHISKDFRYITVHQHKTRSHLNAPLVAYVPDQLVEILQEAKRRARGDLVISYQGKPVAALHAAVRGAVERAAATGRPHLTYGRRDQSGITFHTLRHTAATILADLDVAPEKRQKAMGHKRLETTMRYTHLRPRVEAPVAEILSAAVQIKDLVLATRMRPPAVPAAVPTRRSVERKTGAIAKSRQQPSDRAKSR